MTIAETPERVLARKVASRVKVMNSKAAEFESLIFLVVEHFALEALRQAENDKLEEAARTLRNHSNPMLRAAAGVVTALKKD